MATAGSGRAGMASSVIELLNHRATFLHDKEAYIFLPDGRVRTKSITYEKLEIRAMAIAAKLQRLQGTERPVVLAYPSGLNYISSFFGCLYAGVIPIAVCYPIHHDPSASISRLRTIVEEAGPSVLLTTASIAASSQKLIQDDPVLGRMRWMPTDVISSDYAEKWQKPYIHPETRAVVAYTTGATGSPKGVLLTHRNLLYNAETIQRCFETRPDCLSVTWLPLSCNMGLMGGILQPLYGGYPSVIMSPESLRANPLAWLQAISRYKATISGGPSEAYEVCLERISPKQSSRLELSHWDVAYIPSDASCQGVMERFAERFRACGFQRKAFSPSYSATEATSLISGVSRSEEPVSIRVSVTALSQNRVELDDGSDDACSVASCGSVDLPHSVKIVDPVSCVPLAEGNVGEIWVSGSCVGRCYWNAQNKSGHVFGAKLQGEEKRGYARTGGLGFVWDRKLYITGRLADIIVIQQRVFYPQHIERTAEKSCERSARIRSAAFAIQAGRKEGLVLVAACRLIDCEPERTYDVIQRIRMAVEEKHQLSPYDIVLVGSHEICRAGDGEIQRHAIREAYLNRTLKTVNRWRQDSGVRHAPLKRKGTLKDALNRIFATGWVRPSTATKG